MTREWTDPQFRSWSAHRIITPLLFLGSNANMVNRSGVRTQGVFRGPLWSMGNNNENRFLHSPESDNYPDCKISRSRSPGGLQGVLCARPAFSRMRLICSCFSQLQQRKRRKERKEKGLSVLLKRSMSSHTRWQARASPDTIPLISRPENWRAAYSWATAQGLAGPQGPTEPCALPHPANRKASLGKPGCNWLPGC